MSSADESPTITDLLAAAVREAVGSRHAQPRPGQAELACDIDEAFRARAGVLGEAPTGTGKSLAHLCAAAAAWLRADERTLVSTESLTLQSQFLTKDLPVVARAVQQLARIELPFAVLKGVSNYADPLRLTATFEHLTGVPHVSLEEGFDIVGQRAFRMPPETPGSKAEVLGLLEWAVEAVTNDRATGDRADYRGPLTDELWSLVSAPSNEAASVDDTPYVPPAQRAKDVAAGAGIVVTNHSVLGLHVTQPFIVLGKRLGTFHHVVVDEGHALPSHVRSQGASRLSAAGIRRCIAAVRRSTGGDRRTERFEGDSRRIASDVNDALRRYLGPRAARTVEPGDKPIGDSARALLSLLSSADRALSAAADDSAQDRIARRSAEGRIERLRTAVRTLEDRHPTIAAWVEADGDAIVAKTSPVDVAPLIRSRLWRRPPAEGENDDDGDRGFAIVSATIPRGFHREVAAPPVDEYTSPFAEAYSRSAAYVPAIAGTEFEQLVSDRHGRRSFDTERHAQWCENEIVELVLANEGHALVLAATKSAGLRYADALRSEADGITVLSQWDRRAPRATVQAWVEETSSVLVGTRSLMSGVDAPGETCSLVILDRPPRALKNAIDDARVELLVQRGLGRWVADTQVYVSDAALLVDQAAGRLIRAVSDSGLVAVLDPRLNRRSHQSYTPSVLGTYRRPFARFGAGFSDRASAVEWLTARRSRR